MVEERGREALKRLWKARAPNIKLLDGEGLQFIDVKVAVFRKRQHHRGDADCGSLGLIAEMQFAGEVKRGWMIFHLGRYS